MTLVERVSLLANAIRIYCEAEDKAMAEIYGGRDLVPPLTTGYLASSLRHDEYCLLEEATDREAVADLAARLEAEDEKNPSSCGFEALKKIRKQLDDLCIAVRK